MMRLVSWSRAYSAVESPPARVAGRSVPRLDPHASAATGPNQGIHDHGARMMAALASTIDSNDPDEIDRIIREGIPDPIGSFYRFGLAASHLRRKKLEPVN